VFVLIVAGFIGSLNVTVTSAEVPMPVALFAGLTAVTVGGVVSGGTTSGAYTTSTQ
jgi:hypothetical protein